MISLSKNGMHALRVSLLPQLCELFYCCSLPGWPAVSAEGWMESKSKGKEGSVFPQKATCGAPLCVPAPAHAQGGHRPRHPGNTCQRNSGTEVQGAGAKISHTIHHTRCSLIKPQASSNPAASSGIDTSSYPATRTHAWTKNFSVVAAAP